MNTEVMLTTFDNPYDPFDEFTLWLLFDNEKGYNTCGKIARIARSSTDFSTIEEKIEIERAIDEIVDNDFLNIYKKLTREIGNESEKDSEKDSTTNDIN